MVTRCCLGSKDENAGWYFQFRVLQQPAIQRKDVQKIEVLPFVFVQSFDLYIKEGIWIDLQTKSVLYRLSERLFISIFDRSEIFPKRSYISLFLQASKQRCIRNPFRSNGRLDQLRKLRIASDQPTPGGNSIGFVIET